MRTPRRTLCSLALLLPIATLAADPLAAGTVITIAERDLPDGTAETTTMSVDGQLIAIVGDPADGRMIFRGDRQQMLLVDDTEKSYAVIDETMMTGIATQMSAMMKQMEEALASLPEAQREAARRMMTQQANQQAPSAPPPVEPVVVRTSELATREGFPCVKHEVFEGDVKIRELWVTDWSNVGGQGDIASALSSLSDFVSTLTSSLGSLGQGAASTIGSSIASHWHGIQGMPIVTTELEDGTPVEESVVRSVEAVTLDHGQVFDVPEDYDLEALGAASEDE